VGPPFSINWIRGFSGVSFCRLSGFPDFAGVPFRADPDYPISRLSDRIKRYSGSRSGDIA